MKTPTTRDILILIIAFGTLVGIHFTIKGFNKRAKERERFELLDVSKCHIPFERKPFFKDIYIGMHISDYSYKDEESVASFKGEFTSGNIHWSPQFYNDTLVTLSLKFNDLSNKYYDSDGSLAQDGYFKILKDFESCGQVDMPDGESTYACGRIKIYFNYDLGIVRVSDLCYEQKQENDRKKRENAMRHYNDSIKVAQDKELWN